MSGAVFSIKKKNAFLERRAGIIYLSLLFCQILIFSKEQLLRSFKNFLGTGVVRNPVFEQLAITNFIK